MRLLLVEDDELLGEAISQALNRRCYPHEWVKDGQQALTSLLTCDYDLVVLDLGLPGLDGTSVIGQLRLKGRRCAVLVISARNQPQDRIVGLDLGADDYLGKPFEIEELLARVRAVERRLSGALNNELRLGDIVLALQSLDVSYKEQWVQLQRREWVLLKHLMEAPKQIHTRGQLELAVYGSEGDVESNSIDVHVHHLRKKLYPEVVKTIRGVGYRFDPQAVKNGI